MYEIHTERRVEFSDTDMAGIVHFSRLIVFMENAEHRFIEALGASVVMKYEGHTIGWPRVFVSCNFDSPACFHEIVDLHVQVLRKGRSSLTYGFTIKVGERLVARGKMTSVCCIMDPDTGPRSIPIPPFIADQIQQVPESRLASTAEDRG